MENGMLLVVGGAGYIGSHIVRELTKASIPCLVLDDLSTGHREAVRGVELVVGSITDSDLLDSITLPADAGVQKPDARIFRLALERLGLAANEVAFVGDDAERDLAGARDVGMNAVDAGSLATLEDLSDHLQNS